MNTIAKNLITEQYNELTYLDWSLQISKSSPNDFQLFYLSQAIFKGHFELVNNLAELDLDQISWQFRAKENKLEQWCNLQMSTSISISMTYSFRQGALVIDYLARSSNPTRLDIRHNMEQVESSYQLKSEQSNMLSKLKPWEHEKDDKPSAYLLESNKTEFREAFSSTQWIVLEQEM